MVWISFIILSCSVFAKEIPKFLTKHSLNSIRYITDDGRYAYLQKRQGVLGLVSSFLSTDFISESSQSDFNVKDSRFKRRLIIEAIPGILNDYNIIKNHKIMVVDWGKSQPREIGFGRTARLHLDDEWISYYQPTERLIIIQNVITQKKYQIKLSSKTSPYYFPEVEMISSDTIVYSDVNEKGYSALIQYNLVTQKSNVIFKTTQTGTRLEICQNKGFLAFGEFPYDDIARSSKIFQIKLAGSSNLTGFTTLYSSADSDLGNMICLENSIYFIKTLTHDRKLNVRRTEAARLDLKSSQIKTVTDLSAVTQIISMDKKVLVPFRGEFYVLEGISNLTDDKLKIPTVPDSNEELPLEI